MIAAIDFDGVIHNYKQPLEGMRMGAPIEGSEDAIKRLKRKGYKIIVHTTRGSEENKKHVEEWLDYYKIPYDEVTNVKPNASFYLDDKGVKFTNWDESLEQIWQIK